MSSQEDYHEISTTKIKFNDSIPVDQRIIFICLGVEGGDAESPSESVDVDIKYEYNEDQSIKTERTYSSGTESSLLKEVAYTYAGGRVLTESVTQGNVTIRKTFQYDASFNVVRVISRKM
ncbi:hypothetical protein D3C75_954550 [compost metagenome]